MLRWKFWAGRRDRMALNLVGIFVLAAGLSVISVLSDSVRGTVTRAYEETWRASYDIVVHMPLPNGARMPELMEPNLLTTLPAGITLSQWEQVRAVPGVEVAAPLAVVGYLPAGPSTLFPSEEVPQPPDGLYQARSTMYTTEPAPAQRIEDRVLIAVAVKQKPNPTWPQAFVQDTRTRVLTKARLPLLLAGIDPASEQQLAGLDHAVTEGRYLRRDDAVQWPTLTNGNQLVHSWPSIPVMVNLHAFRGMAYTYTLEELNPDLSVKRVVLARSWGTDELAAAISLGDAAEQVLNVHQLLGRPDPLDYRPAESPFSDRWPAAVTAVPKAADVQQAMGVIFPGASLAVDLGPTYRTLFKPEPTMTPEKRVLNGQLSYKVIGYFDSAELTTVKDPVSNMPLQTYRPAEALRVLDPKGRPLNPPVPLAGGISPVGFLSAPPALLTTIEGAMAVAGDGIINAIQVKVNGTEHFTPEVMNKVRQVAREIEERTGLTAEVTMGSSPMNVLVEAPPSAGHEGFGWTEERWIHTNAGVTTVMQVEFGYSAFLLIVLAVGVLYTLATALAGVSARRRELGVAVATGWPGRAIARLVMSEQLLFGLTAGLLAAGAAWLQGAPQSSLLKMLGVGVITYVPAMLAAGFAAARTRPGDALRWGDTAPGLRVLPGTGLLPLAISSLMGRPLRVALTAVAIGLPTALLVVLTFVTQHLKGVLYTNLTGEYAALRAGPAQYLMGIIALSIAAVTAYDLARQNAADHRNERALLHALGWPRLRIAMTLVAEGGILGVAAGLLGAVLGLAVLGVLYGNQVMVAWNSALVAAALPALLGLATGGLSAIAERRSWNRAGLAGVNENQVARYSQRAMRVVAAAVLMIAVGAGLWFGARPAVQTWTKGEPSVGTAAAADVEAAVAEQNRHFQVLNADAFLATIDPDASPYARQLKNWLADLQTWRQANPAAALSRTAANVALLGDNTARVTLTETVGDTTRSLESIWVRSAGGQWLEHGRNYDIEQVGDVILWYPGTMSPPLVRAVTGRAREAAELLKKHSGWQPATPVVIELHESRSALRDALGPTRGAREDFVHWVAAGEPIQIPADATAVPLLVHSLTMQAVADRSQNLAPGWLQEGLARYVTEKATGAEPWAALDLLAPTGPVSFSRLAALPPGTLAVGEYERAAATARMLAAFLEESQGPEALEELPLGLPPAELEREFHAWLTEQQANHARAVADRTRPVVPTDPMPWMHSYSHAAPAVRAQYALDIQLDPMAHRLNATQTVVIPNNEAVAVDSLYFHLFPNAPAFRERNGQPLERPGDLTVRVVRVNGKAVPFTGGNDEILGLALPTPLAPGKTVRVELHWQVTVPGSRGRFGAEGSTLYLGNFYPILAMHDAGGWHLDRYLDGGDPFYSAVADYDVTLTVPSSYTAVASGEPISPAAGRYRFQARQVRDFAAVISPDFEVHTETVAGVRLHLYAPKPGTAADSDIGTPESAMAVIRDAVRFFREQFGPYPYADLTVVGQMGMEYPQLVMAANPEIIVHEIAHQWWYGVAGNNELRQIWDEGLTVFSERYYQARETAASGPGARPKPIDASLYQMAPRDGSSGGDYPMTMYGKAWRLWEALRTNMGDEAFLQMVRQFYARHQFGVATWADWRDAVAEAGGPEAVAIFDTYVYGAELPADAPSAVAPRKE